MEEDKVLKPSPGGWVGGMKDGQVGLGGDEVGYKAILSPFEFPNGMLDLDGQVWGSI